MNLTFPIRRGRSAKLSSWHCGESPGNMNSNSKKNTPDQVRCFGKERVKED